MKILILLVCLLTVGCSVIGQSSTPLKPLSVHVVNNSFEDWSVYLRTRVGFYTPVGKSLAQTTLRQPRHEMLRNRFVDVYICRTPAKLDCYFLPGEFVSDEARVIEVVIGPRVNYSTISVWPFVPDDS